MKSSVFRMRAVGRALLGFGLLLILVAVLMVRAADTLVSVPTPQTFVTDVTATLTAQQRESLETRLRDFESRKGSQLSVLLVPTTQPEAIEQYALRVVEQWKLGRKKVDDGALLLVAKNDRAVRIEVGYGLEGVLNDAIAKRIINEIILPRFKQGDYFSGIDDSINQMIKVIEGEALPPTLGHPDNTLPDVGHIAPVLLVIAVVLGGILRALLGRLTGAVLTAGLLGLIVWFLSRVIVLALLGAMFGFLVTLFGGLAARHGGWYGGGSGGFGSGGFRGGGGGFGGGGASGRW